MNTKNRRHDFEMGFTTCHIKHDISSNITNAWHCVRSLKDESILSEKLKESFDYKTELFVLSFIISFCEHII